MMSMIFCTVRRDNERRRFAIIRAGTAAVWGVGGGSHVSRLGCRSVY